MLLLTDKVRRALPPLGATEPEGLKAVARVKFFTPDGGWTWFASEFDGEDIFYALVAGLALEFGTFRLSELQTIRGALGLLVERDKFVKPKPLQEIFDEYARYY